ncbi:MAG: prepilin-type N-terminal cleavage/methylation domain-containing protein, partial [Desulfovibrio sp.]
MKRFGKGDGGFTMLEIIAVIVVVAVLAAMAFSSMDRNDETVATARAIESQLRFAQLKAMSDVEEWGIQVTADSCTLMYNGIASTTVFMPGESTSIYNFPSGVTVSGGTGLIEFDYRG